MSSSWVAINSVPSAGGVEIGLPWSKSIVNRLLVIRALAGEPLPGLGDNLPDDIIRMQAGLQPAGNNIDVGDAGTAYRFLTAYYSLRPGDWRITGSEHLLQRPIEPLLVALREMGANIAEREGFEPPRINGGQLYRKELNLPHNISSQFVSALLLIAPYVKGGLKLSISPEQVSISYIRTTLELMRKCGALVSVESDAVVVEEGGYRGPFDHLERDWSSAAYWMAWVAAGDLQSVVMPGLHRTGLQADEGMVDLMEQFGLKAEENELGTRFRRFTSRINDKPVIDMQNMPDQAQTIACLCARLRQEVFLKGLGSLTYKESDRVEALASELTKCGTQIKTTSSSLDITGFKENVEIPRIKTYNDHRMALSFSLLAGRFPGIIIEDPDVVNKSYPAYWCDLEKAGSRLEWHF